MSVAILISTFDRYAALARWTASQIERHWREHPPIFYSGLREKSEQSLGFLGDAADWMRVTLHALEELQQRGFRHAYLILDDHPPVGPCHEEALNQTLPSLAKELDALYIGLLGYGQHRPIDGRVLGASSFFLEQSSIDYRWKFSLHPGLWELEGLRTILLHRIASYQPTLRTAWNFERHRADPSDPKMGLLMERSYRINGALFLKKRVEMTLEMLLERAVRLAADGMLFKARVTGGPSARHAAQKRLFWRYGHYLGPYPLFWSGVMQQGEPHRDWERWLQHSFDRELQRSWESVKQRVFVR